MNRTSPILLDGRALLDADRLIRLGLAERRASFELWFESLPPHVGFAVVAGVESALDALARTAPDEASVEAAQRAARFSDELRTRLEGRALAVDIDAMPDGTLAFAAIPVAVIEGPFLDVALFAPILRAAVERGSAVATRAARLHLAASGGVVVDATSARAATPESSLPVARAAHVGGAAATTNAAASAALGIPFRSLATLDVATEAGEPEEGAWGASAAELLVELGPGDDEESMLLEARRLGLGAGGWLARSLDAQPTGLHLRCELVALEQDGAWTPRRGASDRADIVPGRKRVARYVDAEGRPVGDLVHLAQERMPSPRELGAAGLAPLASAVVRGGRRLEARELASVGRERCLNARHLLPPGLLRLRSPAAYRVELAPEAAALRFESAGG